MTTSLEEEELIALKDWRRYLEKDVRNTYAELFKSMDDLKRADYIITEKEKKIKK